MKAKLLISIYFIFSLTLVGYSQSKSSKNTYQWSWGEFKNETESSSNSSPVNPKILATLFPDTRNNAIEEFHFIQSISISPNPVQNGEIATVYIVPNESDTYQIGIYDSKGKNKIQLFEGILEKGKQSEFEFHSQKLDAGYSYVKISSKKGYSHVSKLFIIK